MSSDYLKYLDDFGTLIKKEDFSKAARVFKKMYRNKNWSKDRLLEELGELCDNKNLSENSKLACSLLSSKVLLLQNKKKKAYDRSKDSLLESTELNEKELKDVISIAEKVQGEAFMPKYMKYVLLQWWFWLVIGATYILANMSGHLSIGRRGFLRRIAWNQSTWVLVILFYLLFFLFYYKRFNRMERKLIKRFDAQFEKYPHTSLTLFSKIGSILVWTGAIIALVIAYFERLTYYFGISDWYYYHTWRLVGDITSSIIEGLFGYMIAFFSLMAILIVAFFIRLPMKINWQKIWLNPVEEDKSGGFITITNFLLRLVMAITTGSIFVLGTLTIYNYVYVNMDGENLLTFVLENYLVVGAYTWYYIAYAILPIAALLIIVCLPILVFYRYLSMYKNDRLPSFVKKRNDFIDNLAEEKNFVEYTEEELIQLQRHDYFIDKISTIKILAINMPIFLKALYTILPFAIKYIAMLVDRLNIGNTSAIVAIIATLLAAFSIDRK